MYYYSTFYYLCHSSFPRDPTSRPKKLKYIPSRLFGRLFHCKLDNCTSFKPSLVHLRLPLGFRRRSHRSNSLHFSTDTDAVYLTPSFNILGVTLDLVHHESPDNTPKNRKYHCLHPSISTQNLFPVEWD